MVSGSLTADLERAPGPACTGGDPALVESSDPRRRSSGCRAVVKSQRAYAEHVIECIRRISEDSAPGRNAVLASRTLQDAIVRNLQILCESTQRISEPHEQRHPEIDGYR